VDEFQDISRSRYRLIKALLDQSQEHKLFCVGDDWQSIYRFTGSDVSIMTSFEELFQPSEITYLPDTFRFSTQILDVSSRFIMKNRAQMPKELVAAEAGDTLQVCLVACNDINEALVDCLDTIDLMESGAADVFVIGRYNHSAPTRLKRIAEQFPRLNIRYLTAHKSKGLEADYVLVVGLNSGRYGFPCKIEDDPVLNLVLYKDEPLLYAEERRVFYVALTRARKKVCMFHDRSQPSEFVEEILEDEAPLHCVETP
ncbi:UvrD-helicase domain-containing protein, partial [Candidatus Bathyarchaeota archaeon]|nr:UvrD-helicase domain-containing protein [Candidatus Bathyarchaeota archaeon]